MSTQTGPRGSGVTELERVDLARWQAEESSWRGRRPVVLAGAFADTVAVATWTPEGLAERFPDTEVRASHLPPGAWGDLSLVEEQQMTMSCFVRLLRDGRERQLVGHPLERFAGLYGELDIIRAAAPPYMAVKLWLGHRTCTEMHRDRASNLFVQVHGTKRFVIEPPDGPAGRYMHEGRSSHFSRVDPVAPDLVRFPEYHPGMQVGATLEPGDALYLPPRWFHHVTALGTSISVNCWYGELVQA